MGAKKLKTGFSTGTAAAAAAQAAFRTLLTGSAPGRVDVLLPDGSEFAVRISSASRSNEGNQARAEVVKDAGDDPDVTHGAVIGAAVTRIDQDPNQDQVEIEGGPGVGRVTKPGLPVPVGRPAINPVPLQMIEQSVRRVWDQFGTGGPLGRVRVEIFVENGLKLAERTLNPRLGIVGGLSILGTTGLVKPFSHQAYTATIGSSLDVALAEGIKEVVFTTGGKSEAAAMILRPDLPEAAFVQIADFFGFALNEASHRPLARVGVVSFFGKAVKQAAGLDCTHARHAPLDLPALAERFREAGADPDLVRRTSEANTARQVLGLLERNGALDLVRVIGAEALAAARNFAGPEPSLWLVIIDYDGKVLFEGSAP